MQYRSFAGALRARCALGLLVALSACNGSGQQQDGPGDDLERDAEAPYDDELDDSGTDLLDDAAAPTDTGFGPAPAYCRDDSCADGQLCVVDPEIDDVTCVGSCEGVVCAAGLTCRVEANIGRCAVPCSPACGPGQRCEVDGAGAASCTDNSCDFLACGAKQVCAPAAQGSGFVCVDNSCSSDLGCAQSQSCSPDGVCVADVCAPGARTCQGAAVRECAPNGGSTIQRVACPSAAHVVSACVDAAEDAACSCRDDWDCPGYTECVKDRCVGTGRAPSCFLPPLPFADLLPRAEPGFPWGGDDADGYKVDKTAQYVGDPFVVAATPSSRDAKNHPFPHHAQVSATPVVANLTDDNGDGRIDELDSPEIVFTSFCDRNYFNHGVLRALHGGGARAGQELFAVCESKLWREGDPLANDQGALLPNADCTCNQGDLEPTGALAVGDLDADGVPEIVVLGHAASVGSNDVVNNRLVLFRNTGELISSNDVGNIGGADPAVTLANLDGQGLSEIVIGKFVFLLGRSGDGKLVVTRVLSGTETSGQNGGQGPVSCVADLDDDGQLEIVAGGAAYHLPVAPAACPAAPADTDGVAYCSNRLVTRWDRDIDGFCAIADVLGALPETGGVEVPTGPDHPLDGQPEVVLITDGRLRILDGKSGVLRLNVVLDELEGGTPYDQLTPTQKTQLAGDVRPRDGGPPNIDDFDGDGFPEIGTAFDTHYTMYDLQPASAACPAWNATLDGTPDSSDPQNRTGGNAARTPPALGCVSDADCGDPQFTCAKDGKCVCLHNGWSSRTQDASSRVTGSSVFDFNGDGAAEVVYNDECYFRIYEGTTGSVYQRLDSQSPTRIEYPVVADVDSDGNAEIIFSGSNSRSESCVHHDRQTFINGLQVIGEPEDRWISARRIWNQHAYHITNVLEDGRIPTAEVPSWLSYGNRVYNTYRSNLPPIANVAPDLTVSDVQVSSPDVSCGETLSDELRIVARVVNRGDLRVGAQVPVRFSAAVGSADFVTVGTSQLGASLEPSGEVFVSLTFTVASGAAMPTRVRVEVDPEGIERECVESNNAAELAVVTSLQKAELSVELEATDNSCPLRGVRVRVSNDSGRAVPDAVVRLYAGNPAAGGTQLSELHTGPIAAHAQSEWVNGQAQLGLRNVTLHAWVDPDGEIAECDDGDNLSTIALRCAVILL